MGFNVSHVAALAFAVLTGTAAAAPLPTNVDGAPSIQGRDVRSQFLPGAYVISPGATDGGSYPQASGIQQSAPADHPLVQSRAFVASPPVDPKTNALALPELMSSNASDAGTSGSQGGDAQTAFQGVGPGSDGGGASESSPTHLGTVPLPPALPLFGAAVLGLAAFGRSRKRQAAKS